MRYNFNDSFGFLIVKIARLIQNRLHHNFEKSQTPVTPQQWSVLTMLWNEDGVAQQKIADAFSKDKTSMTRLLDNMENNNLISRNKDRQDKRNKNVFLTIKSKEMKDESITIAQSTLNEALYGVSSEDIKICRKVMLKIGENLEKLN
jgi:DNA-binding MarR family transcriptional regulator